MAQGMGTYGSDMGPKLGGAPPAPKLSTTANMGGQRMGGIKPPVAKMGLGGAGAIRQPAAPIKQAPQMGGGRMTPPPPLSAPSVQGAGPTTPESRAAARAKLYAPDGAGWGSFGGPPPPQPADPTSGGFGGGVGPGTMPGTGGPLMAPPGGGFGQPGPPQQGDPMQQDFSAKLQALAQTNPQVFQQILQLLG